MEEIYQMIENKIREAGYEKEVDGYEIYNELCDEMEEKEIGEYIFLVKKEGTEYFEYHVQIYENDFNLSQLVIVDGEKRLVVDFDD